MPHSLHDAVGGCKEEAELWIMPFKSGVRWVHDTGSKRKVTRRTIEESPPHPQSNLFASRPATSREFCLRELARHMRQLVTADSVLSGDRATEIQRRVRHLGSASKGRITLLLIEEDNRVGIAITCVSDDRNVQS